MGGSTHEAMPMLLQVPSLWGPPYSTSILGYGDVVLPGLLVVFARIWDAAFQKPPAASYFWPLILGYGVGLILTFVALVLHVGGSQVLHTTFSFWIRNLLASLLINHS